MTDQLPSHTSNGMSLGTAIGLAEEAFKQKFHREIVVGSDSDKAWFNGYVEALTHDASQAETLPKAGADPAPQYACFVEGCPGNHVSKYQVCASQKNGPGESQLPRQE